MQTTGPIFPTCREQKRKIKPSAICVSKKVFRWCRCWASSTEKIIPKNTNAPQNMILFPICPIQLFNFKVSSLCKLSWVFQLRYFGNLIFLTPHVHGTFPTLTSGWPPISSSYHSLMWVSLLQVNIQGTPQMWSGLSCQVSVNPFWAKTKELSPYLPKNSLLKHLRDVFFQNADWKWEIQVTRCDKNPLWPDLNVIWFAEYWWFSFSYMLSHRYYMTLTIYKNLHLWF